jgi:hypothetical protein
LVAELDESEFAAGALSRRVQWSAYFARSPHFTRREVGEALMEAMTSAPNLRMTVLCGHTHTGSEAQPLPNLRVLTGAAKYGQPTVQQVVEVE